MKLHESIRGALEKPETLTLIKSLLKKRGFKGDRELVDTLVTDVVIKLLEREEYYETQFKHSLSTFIGQVITTVVREALERPDVLDGDLLYLDTPVSQEEMGETLTIHDLFDESAVLADLPTFITQPGVADKMTYYLSQLPDRQADAFTLMYVYGHTAEDVADLMGISIQTVYGYVKEAKITLAEFRRSEEAYEAKLEIGDVCGRIISNNDTGNVWADQFWQERHAQPGEVYHYSAEEIIQYCNERGLC